MADVVERQRIDSERQGERVFLNRQAGTAAVKPQPDLLAQLCARKRDPAGHARVLKHLIDRKPSRAANSVLQLQRGYGNRYAQRVMNLARQDDGSPSDAPDPVSLPQITFERDPAYYSYEGGCDGLQLHGKADAAFGSKGTVVNQIATPVKDCGCDKGVQCFHVTGTLVTDYSVSVTITMPSVPSELNDCEQRKVQAFLRDVLRPHEEDHKTRLMTYQGQTKNRVDVTGCGSDDIAQKVQAIGDAEDGPRQAAANALSGAIDPFTSMIDCSDCAKGN